MPYSTSNKEIQDAHYNSPTNFVGAIAGGLAKKALGGIAGSAVPSVAGIVAKKGAQKAASSAVDTGMTSVEENMGINPETGQPYPSAAPFKLRSQGSSFKEMGSSPVAFLGGLFGKGGSKNPQAVVAPPAETVEPTATATTTTVPPHGEESHTGGGGGGAGGVVAGGGGEAPWEVMGSGAFGDMNKKDARSYMRGLTKDQRIQQITSNVKGGIGGLSAMGGIGGMFSDVRLKEKIEKAGKSPSGIPIYEFNYIGDNNRYSGAMAQDLLDINPDAVSLDSSGYYKVNYNNIDVDMHLIN